MALISLATPLTLSNGVKAATRSAYTFLREQSYFGPRTFSKQHARFHFRFPCSGPSLLPVSVGPVWSLRVHTQTPGWWQPKFLLLRPAAGGGSGLLVSAGRWPWASWDPMTVTVQSPPGVVSITH